MPLSTIRVLWRQPNGSMSLWGIPYPMRPGQAPRDLYERFDGPAPDWIWLGSPGWWGAMTRERIEEVKAFLAPLREQGLIPTGPGEWADIKETK